MSRVRFARFMLEYPVEPANLPSARQVTAKGSRIPAAASDSRPSIQWAASSTVLGAGTAKNCQMASSWATASMASASSMVSGSSLATLPSRVSGWGSNVAGVVNMHLAENWCLGKVVSLEGGVRHYTPPDFC